MSDDPLLLSDEEIAAARSRIEGNENILRTDFQANVLTETDSPDDVAFDLEVAEREGKPRIAISPDREMYRSRVELDKLRSLKETAPRLAEWMQGPDNYAVARDDIEVMGKIIGKDDKSLLKTIGYDTESLGRSLALSGLDFLKPAGPRLSYQFRFGDDGLESELVLDQTPFDRAYAQMRPQRIAAELEGIERAQTLANAYMPESENWLTQGVYDATRSSTYTVLGLGLSYLTRMPLLSTAGTSTIGTGGEYGRARVAGLDPETAAEFWAANALVEFGTEAGPAAILFGKNAAGDSIKKRLVKALFADTAGEGVAAAGQHYLDWAYINPDKTPEQFWEEMPETVRRGMMAGLIMSGAMSGPIAAAEAHYQRNVEKVRQSQMGEGERDIENQLKQAKKSRTRARAPEKFREAIAGDLEGTAREETIIDLDGILPALEEQGVETGALFQSLGLTEEQVAEAYQIGGEVTVKTADLLTSEIAVQNDAIIKRHARREGELTPAVREATLEAIRPSIEQEMELIREKAETDLTLAEQVAEVEERVFEQVKATGAYQGEELKAQARLFSAMSNIAAERAGVDPVQFYEEQFGVKIFGPSAGQAEDGALDQGVLTLDDGQKLLVLNDPVMSPDENGFTTTAERAINNPPPRFRDAKALRPEQWRKYFKDAGATGEAFEFQIERALKELEPDAEGKITKAALAEAMKRLKPEIVVNQTKITPELQRRYARTAAEVKQLRAQASDGYLEASKREQAKAKLEQKEAELGAIVDEMGETDYSEIVGPGKIKGYGQEVILMPESEYTHNHWRRSPGCVIGHIRWSDRKTTKAKKFRYVEEIQSDLHQEAAENGFRREGYSEETLKENREAADRAYSKILDWYADKHKFSREEVEDIVFNEGRIDWDAESPTGDQEGDLLVAEYKQALAIYERGGTWLEGQRVKRTPASSWERPFITRALQRAIADGLDVVAFPVHDSLNFMVKGEGTRKFYNERIPRILKKLAKAIGAEFEYVEAEMLKDTAEFEARIQEVNEKYERGELTQQEREAFTEELREQRRDSTTGVRAGKLPAIRLTPEAKAKLAEGNALFQSSDSPTGQFSPATRQLFLRPGADMSTLAHEGAHAYLDMLERLATDEDAHPFFVEQLAAVESWFSSIENTKQMKAIRERYDVREEDGIFVTYEGDKVRGRAATREQAEADIRWRERQEAFAETFELFLEKGKAPSSEMFGVFSTFRRWLTYIYKSTVFRMSRQARANLNPEITQVFNRMLATDAAIDRAKAKSEVDFDRFARSYLKRRKLTEEQEAEAVAKLRGRFEEMIERVREEYIAEGMKKHLKAKKAVAKGIRDDIEADVTRETDKLAGRRATEWLGGGRYKGDLPESEIAEDEGAVYQGSIPAEQSAWGRAVAKGLDMSQEARMARAKAMGFDTKNPVYHGTVHEFEEFSLQPPRSDSAFRLVHPNDEGAVFVTPDVDLAESYAKFDGRTPLRKGEREKFQHGSHVRKLLIKRGKQLVINAKGKEWVDVWPDALAKARAGGYDTIKIKNVQDWGRPPELTPRQKKKYLRRVSMGYDVKDPLRTSIAVLNPSNIRSVHAAFDPDNSGSARILDQFVGEQSQSQTIHDRINEAERLEMQGFDRDIIWRQTLTYRGVDGLWHAELDVSQAELKAAFERALQSELPIRAALAVEIPQIAESYPELLDSIMIEPKVRDPEYTPGGGLQVRGERDATLSVSAANSDEALSIILHELQHAIQNIEGFAYGTNPAVVMKTHSEEVKAEFERLKLENPPTVDDVINQSIEDMLFEVERETELYRRAAHEVYKRHAGEVEARNVQTRQNMTLEERRKNPPWKSADRPESRQIITYAGVRAYSASVQKGFADKMRREDFLLYETEQETIGSAPKGAVRYGFKLPGDKVPLLVEVMPDPYTGVRRIDTSRFDVESWNRTAPEFTEAKLEQFKDRLHAIAEANLTREGLSVQVEDALEAEIYEEVFARVAGENYKIERFREQEVFLIPRQSVLTEQGTVPRSKSSRSFKPQGSERSGTRAAFIDRTTDANFPERLRRAVEDRARRREADRVAGEEYREQFESWMGRMALDQSGGTKAPIFFSQLQRFVENAKQPKAPADQWKAMIKKAPGIKAEEIEWTGVNEWLDAQEGSVSREDLAAYLANNGVTVEEVTKGGVGRDAEGQRSLLNAIERRAEIRTELDEDYYSLANDPSDMADDKREAMFALEAELDQLDLRIESLEAEFDGVPEDGTKWSSWTLPGGENYTELLLKFPERKPTEADFQKYLEGYRRKFPMANKTDQEIREYFDQGLMTSAYGYRSSHWDEPNVLAHVRFKERTGPNGERILAMEEIQSDWHQTGRKYGYKDERRANDLKEKITSVVNGLSLDRIIEVVNKSPGRFGFAMGWEDQYRSASDKGYWEEVLRGRVLEFATELPTDSLAPTLKEIDAEMKELRNLRRSTAPNAPFKNNAWASLVIKRMIRHAAENGFDAIAWIPGNVQNGQFMEDTEDNRSDFYDKIIPNLAGKIGKKYGAKVGKSKLPIGEGVENDAGEIRVSELADGTAQVEWDGGDRNFDTVEEALAFERELVGKTEDFWSLPITPELKAQAIQQGFPLFQRGPTQGDPNQGGGEKTLFVAHNVSEEKLIKSLDLGGLPMPSLAVARTDKGGFQSYGEITLLADPSILDEKDVTAYDADIYSPTVPEAYPVVDEAEAKSFVKENADHIPKNSGVRPYLSYDETTSDRDFARTLGYSDFVRVAFLASEGRVPKVKRLQIAPEVREALNTEWNSPERSALALKYWQRQQNEYNEARIAAGRSVRNDLYVVDGKIDQHQQDQFDRMISEYNRSPYNEKEFARELDRRVGATAASRKRFDAYTQDLAKRLTKGKRMFKGYSYSGNRTWAAFNLENVMKKMRKDLRENNHHSLDGTGSIRARTATKPMKTVAAVQANRDRIVSEEEAEQFKEGSSQRFQALADEIFPYLKYSGHDANTLQYWDMAAEVVAGGPREWRDAFEPEAIPIIQEYVNELKGLPTEYFEAKANRVMQLQDFAVAVVPRNISAETKERLKASGIKLRYYKSGDEVDRLRAVKGQQSVLFQSGDPKGWGPVDPPEDLEEVTLDLDAVRDGYGKPDDPYYAVRRLPLQVRRAAAAKQDIDAAFEQAKQARQILKEKPPKSLIGFLRSRRIKGLKDPNGELKRMDAGRERGLINNKSGTDLDYAREAAEEAGYISPSTEDGRTTIQDLLDALDSELAGNPVYAPQDFADAVAREQAEEIEARFSAVDVDIMTADDATLRSAAEGMLSQGQRRAVTPDEAAEMFGFQNGEQLLEAMYQLRHRRKIIREETDRRFAEEMGDNFMDGQIVEEARLEAEAEIRIRQAEIEQEAIRRVLGGQSAKALAKEKAKERVRQMSVAELGRYRRFKQAERRHGANALKALEDGDLQQSMMHKQRQLVAMYMYEEAEKASEKVEKTRKHLLGFYTMKGRRRQIDPEYLEKIEAILENYEFRSTKQSGAARKEALSAAQWVLEMTQAERQDEITPEAELLAEQGRKQVWKALTLEETEFLRATVDNIAHLGRTKNKLLNDREKRKFNQLIDSLVQTLEAAAGDIDGQREYSERPTVREQASRRARILHSWNMRLEHQFRALDKKENGALWNALFRPFAEAADWKSKASRDSAKRVRELYNMYSMRERWHMHNTSRDIPELGAPTGKRWTKMDVISIALNWGVEYNRDALLEGYGWTSEQVEAVLARMMTAKDWDFVEGIWEEAGRYKEEAFALEKQMTGVEPQSVEGIDFEIIVEGQPRKIAGKYYHLEYRNDVLTPQALKQNEQENKEALSTRMKNYTRPQTRNGGLIARKGSGGKQVRLNISVFENQIADTIHDIAYRRAVIDVTRIIKNERFALAFQKAAGPEMYNQLMPWIEGIVKMPSEQLDNYITTMRRNLPASYMGMKVGTAMIQVSGLALAAPIIGARYLAYGVGQTMLGNPMSLIGSYKAVAEKSEFMRDRPQGYDRDIREVTSRMGGEGPLGMIRRNAFVLISAMDIMVSTPIWIGAYQKAMDGKVEGVERGNEADAIAWADSVIRRTQTAGLPQDLARIMRDSESWKMLTMIMGYFNNLYGWSAQQVRSLRAGETGAMQFLAFAMAAYIVTPLIAEALSGRLFDEGEDEDDTLASRAGAAIISNFAGMFPVVRDVVNYKLKPQFGFKMSPVVSGTDDVARTAGSLWDILAQNDNAEWTEVETKRAVRAMGAMFGIPSSQLLITGDYIADVINGEEDPLEEPGRIFTEGLLRNTDYKR